MLIIGNGKTITRDANLPFIEDGAVAIEGNPDQRSREPPKI